MVQNSLGWMVNGGLGDKKCCFSMSHRSIYLPAKRMLYNVTKSCKGNNFSTISILQKTPKIVSAGVATVLGVSRFAKHLEFQPLEPGTDTPADDVHTDADPFAYCAANNIAGSSGSCCAKLQC